MLNFVKLGGFHLSRVTSSRLETILGGNYPPWELSEWQLSWVGILIGGSFPDGNSPVRVIQVSIFRVGVFMLPNFFRVNNKTITAYDWIDFLNSSSSFTVDIFSLYWYLWRNTMEGQKSPFKGFLTSFLLLLTEGFAYQYKRRLLPLTWGISDMGGIDNSVGSKDSFSKLTVLETLRIS